MIKVEHLTKIYKSSKSENVVANNDISFELANNGLVFITGKSGSGKSTLLNILGGLDKKTSGNYFVNGKSIDEFENLDDFRNEFVGFVFQDFNLIESMTVYENLKFVLSIQENFDESKILEALDLVGLNGYAQRKINELSGGQKQRVAIARAIVKNSKFILADEPTGNLDSKTSKDIFELLKNISKTKLVVVISHDNASAKKFADRIISLSDGKVKSDSKINKIRNKKINFDEKKSKSLGTKYSLSLAKNHIFSHFGKSFVSVILFTLTIFSICISFLFLTFNSEKSISKTLDSNFQNIYFSQSIYPNKNDAINFDYYSNINEAVFDEIKQDDKFLIGYNIGIGSNDIEKYRDDAFYLINSKNDILKMKKEYYFLNEANDKGVYLTDYAIDYLLSKNYILSDNLTNDDYTILSGKKVLQYNAFERKYEEKYTINGVIKTDYKQFLNDDFSIKTDSLFGYKTSESYSEFVRQKINLEYIPFYCTKNYLINNKDNVKLQLSKSNSTDLLIDIGVSSLNFNTINLIDIKSFDYDMIDTQGNVVGANSIKLKEDEIVVNLALYNAIFNDNISFEKISQTITDKGEEGKECSYKFSNINKTISMSYLNKTNQNKLLEITDKKIVGIVIKDYFMQLSDGYEIYTSHDITKNNVILSNINNVINFHFDSNNDFVQTLNLLRNKFNIGVFSVEAISIYGFENVVKALSFVFVALSIILTIISLLASISVISFSINSKHKEIGILRALGTKAKDIEKIYVFESLITGFASFVFTLILTIIGIGLINSILGASVSKNIYYLINNYLVYIIIFILSILLNILACLIPLKKINSFRPIDAIKSID